MTTDDKIALVPRGTLIGDKLTILHGGHVPFVLRNAGTDHHFQVIGECFVEGSMRGEAMKDDSIDSTDIVLM